MRPLRRSTFLGRQRHAEGIQASEGDGGCEGFVVENSMLVSIKKE